MANQAAAKPCAAEQLVLGASPLEVGSWGAEDVQALPSSGQSALALPHELKRDRHTPEVRISTVVETREAWPQKFEAHDSELSEVSESVQVKTGSASCASSLKDVLVRRTRTCTSLQSSLPASPVKGGDQSTRTNQSRLAVIGDRSVSVINSEFDPQGGLRSSVEVQSLHGHWEKDYEAERELGRGGFGVVTQVRRRTDGTRFALKTVEVGKLNDSGRFEKEFDVSRRLRHPNIVGLHELFREGNGNLHLLMDICHGGDLFTKVTATCTSGQRIPESFHGGGLTTNEVTTYTWQMLSGLAYLHHYRFTHRDIKLENYMIESKRDQAQLKLIDFGLARQFSKGVPMRSKVGTPSYCAPEVFNMATGGYDERIDIWSAGVCVFLMACGRFPFGGEDAAEIYRRAEHDAPEYDQCNWSRHPKALRSMVELMLVKSGFDRGGPKEFLEDPWLVSQNSPPPMCCAIS